MAATERSYSVKFKKKYIKEVREGADNESVSKTSFTKDAAEAALDEIENHEKVIAVRAMQDYTILTVRADVDDFEEVMNFVVNVFRRLDEGSEVTYSFELNEGV